MKATVKVFPCRPRSAPRPCPGLRCRLQLRQAPQGATMANPVPGHLRCLAGRPVRFQDRPTPPHPGTVQLGSAPRRASWLLREKIPARPPCRCCPCSSAESTRADLRRATPPDVQRGSVSSGEGSEWYRPQEATLRARAGKADTKLENPRPGRLAGAGLAARCIAHSCQGRSVGFTEWTSRRWPRTGSPAPSP